MADLSKDDAIATTLLDLSFKVLASLVPSDEALVVLEQYVEALDSLLERREKITLHPLLAAEISAQHQVLLEHVKKWYEQKEALEQMLSEKARGLQKYLHTVEPSRALLIHTKG
jgi:hypothetical protein